MYSYLYCGCVDCAESTITLGSVHKYFGGVGWAIENFRHQTFWPPFPSRQNFLNPPSASDKNFFDPPPLLDV